MHDKYLHDMHELDRLEHKKIVDAIIFGNNNKKRKRNEVEGLDMEDNPIVKKKRLNEREQDLLRQIDIDDEGFGKSKTDLYREQLLEEDELDEEEIQKQ